MLSIQNNNPYQAYPMYLRAGSVTVLDNSPLTEQELELARDYQDYLEWGRLSGQVARAVKEAGEGNPVDMPDELLQYFEKAHAGGFNNVMSHLHKISYSPIFGAVFEGEDFDLPEQGFRFSSADNSMSFGIGSVIVAHNKARDIYLRIFNDTLGYIHPDDYKDGTYTGVYNPGTDIDYLNVFSSLMEGLKYGNANWGHNADLNNDILEMLKQIGIDTSKEFSINNLTFSVVDGVLQTIGNRPNGTQFGAAYLNALLKKAYEQNMMYEDT
ncbi:MAG: hypothetical protein FWH55_08640 [Oscillospiraceae bacterium]|nr:hypothetical protein [Oscillospiraceae bacterium]